MATPAEKFMFASQTQLPELSERIVKIRGKKIGKKYKTKCPLCKRRTVRIKCERTGVLIPSPRCEICNVRVVLIDLEIGGRQPKSSKKRKVSDKSKWNPHHKYGGDEDVAD